MARRLTVPVQGPFGLVLADSCCEDLFTVRLALGVRLQDPGAFGASRAIRVRRSRRRQAPDLAVLPGASSAIDRSGCRTGRPGTSADELLRAAGFVRSGSRPVRGPADADASQSGPGPGCDGPGPDRPGRPRPIPHPTASGSRSGSCFWRSFRTSLSHRGSTCSTAATPTGPGSSGPSNCISSAPSFSCTTG